MTDNSYAQEYLEHSKMFTKVGYIKHPPSTAFAAAKLARKYGYDAFLMVNSGGANYKTGFLGANRVYGSASVVMVARDEEVLYRQGAKLTSNMSEAAGLSPREIAENLAHVLVDDLAESRQLAENGELKKEDSDLIGKVKGFFN